MPADMSLVLADEDVVQSVLHHLLDNAEKYAPEGSVKILGELKGDVLRIRVSDEGPGIPSEKQRLLFQKFQRLEARDSQSVYGYGLGLYLSRRLLEAMQSDLEYEAVPGGGSCFFFDLKVAK
jgi:K+-sensing histidine kinase KdpD